MYVLPPLPYAENALLPYISQETIFYHYHKHHQGYVDKLNAFLDGNSERSLEDLVMHETGFCFNQAAQVWNHNFYWASMSAQHHQQPRGALLEAILEHFGSVEDFKKHMHDTAMKQFGSGWAWLVAKEGKLSVLTTSNAEVPMRLGYAPLLVIDLWEHAYYIDARHDRSKYIQDFWSIANWAFAEQNFNHLSA